MRGMRTSKTRQLGRSIGVLARNSCADANVLTSRPAERIRFPRDLRTDTSSSTTKTMLPFFTCSLSLILRERKLKCHPRSFISHSPKFPAMIFKDRPADRQTHTETLRLRAIERVENSFKIFMVRSEEHT